MRRGIQVVLTGLVAGLGFALAVLAPVAIRADVGPPAHLRVSEREPGLFVVQWRVPMALPRGAAPVPALPERCEPLERFTVEDQAGAWLFTQEWRCHEGLASQVVGLSFPFADLALTTVVRVDLLSGDRFAHLLTPGDEPWRMPEGTLAPDRLRDAAQAAWFGTRHAFVSWAHLPFILLAGLLGGVPRAVHVVTAFTLAQIAGLLASLLLPGLEVAPAEMVVGLVAALLAREALRPADEARRFVALTGSGGFVHGLAVGAMLTGRVGGEVAGPFLQLLGVLGMDAGHLVGASAVAAVAFVLRQKPVTASVARGAAYSCGVAGIALALGLAVEGGAAPPSATELTVSATTLATRDRVAAGSGSGSRPVAPAAPEAPVQSFLIVEPFELRHEVMLRPGRFARVLGLDPAGVVGIPEQTALTELLVALVLDGASIRVDGQVVEGTPQRVGFMTVDSTGALPRSRPLPEPVAEAVVGVVMTYPTAGMPQRVSLSWNTFPGSVALIPAAVIDPESTRTATLTATEPTLTWENDLAEDPLPAVVAVNVEPLRVPLP